MSDKDEYKTQDDDFDSEQLERIDRLKERASELAGGEMNFYESEDIPPDIQEEFWKHVIAFEESEHAPLFDRLIKAGVELPAPDELSDEQIHEKLWEIVHALQLMNTYLEQTNHLSDRELYEKLWSDILREDMFVMTNIPNFHCGLDILGSYGEEETYLYLKHYANEEWREQWLKDFPDYKMPAHEDPKYDRDRFLPKHEMDISELEM
jgi:hypothetical protein